MWNKNWKTYKQRKLSNRSKQIKDLHNHTNSRQNQSKHRMPANVSVKGGKTKRTLKTRGKNACWDAPGKSAFMLAFCFSIQRNIFDAFRYKEGGPTRSGSRYDGGRGGQRQLPYYSCTLLDFFRPITETSNKLPSAIYRILCVYIYIHGAGFHEVYMYICIFFDGTDWQASD